MRARSLVFLGSLALLAGSHGPALAECGGARPVPQPPMRSPKSPDESKPGESVPTPPDSGGGTPSPRDKAGTPTGPGRKGGRPMASGLDSWEEWWRVHRDRVTDLRRRYRESDARVATSPDGNPSAGNQGADGRRSETGRFLEKMLSDGDWEIRADAAVALGRAGVSRAFPRLLHMALKDHRNVRGSAGIGAGLIGDPMAVEDLEAMMLNRREETWMRSVAALSLGLTGDEGAVRALRDYLDPAADRRRGRRVDRRAVLDETAVAALGYSGHASAAPFLREVLASDRRDDRTRAFALGALARLGDDKARPLLRQALRDDTTVIRQFAAASAPRLMTEADEDALANLAQVASEDRDVTARRFATLSLGQIGGELSRRVLMNLLARGKATDRPFIVLALGLAGEKAAAPSLQKMFRSSGEPELQGAIAISLGLLGHAPAAEQLTGVVDSRRDHHLRGYCLTALGLMGHDEAADLANRYLSERGHDPEMVPAAVECLALLGRHGDLRVLARVLGSAHEDHHHRGAAFRVVGMLGDERNVPWLRHLASDDHHSDNVRAAAVRTIGAILEEKDVSTLTTLAMDQQFMLFRGPLKAVLGHR
ncbi:MAG: HEAT repeat domain-containing protein [Planctomycetota bacterium]